MCNAFLFYRISGAEMPVSVLVEVKNSTGTADKVEDQYEKTIKQNVLFNMMNPCYLMISQLLKNV